MKNLGTALLKIKEDPIKYIGEKSVNRLHLFIVGYIIRQYEEDEIYPNELDGFHEFVQKKYNILCSKRWSEIIKCFSISDEQAFEEFYNLLEEFYEMEDIS